ncbi:hypothetical protein CspeluHIS016_0104020 [Cutaneotrichosporon spelunceum]|uniref:Uncharacterized protein n=1 Tax=Cutaneotrichosporon spelunceum TaxID=1672016 RepID=A0AAD3TMU2_9TREE|nr:hypothetical protein CspeluHIS016_0104020 [Cutaneotrichosporon spelunceum]
MAAPTHLRVRVSPADELSVLTPTDTVPFAAYAASTSLASVRILDLDLEPTRSPPRVRVRVAARHCRRAWRRWMLWTWTWCAGGRRTRVRRRVVNLDCTGLSAGGEGDEFRLAALGGEVGVYSGLWEYDEFPRFVVESPLPAHVVVRVMAPGDDEGEEGEREGEGAEEGEGGEGEEGEGEWEDEEEADDEPEPGSHEDKMRALMAQTKYLPLAAFIAQAKGTQFTLVDVESWDEDEAGVEDKLRAEIVSALGGRDVADAVRFLSADAYATEVGHDVFRLESENAPPW